MKRITLVCSVLVMTFGLALSVPGSAHATDGAPKHSIHVYHVAHRQTIPVSAEALAPLPRPVRETDGLSRNVEDCNMGCIDN